MARMISMVALSIDVMLPSLPVIEGVTGRLVETVPVPASAVASQPAEE